MPSNIMTVQEAADCLGVSYITMYRILRYDTEICPTKVEGRYRVPTEMLPELRRLVAEREERNPGGGGTA